jgi:hypothetical protein
MEMFVSHACLDLVTVIIHDEVMQLLVKACIFHGIGL